MRLTFWSLVNWKDLSRRRVSSLTTPFRSTFVEAPGVFDRLQRATRMRCTIAYWHASTNTLDMRFAGLRLPGSDDPSLKKDHVMKIKMGERGVNIPYEQHRELRLAPHPMQTEAQAAQWREAWQVHGLDYLVVDWKTVMVDLEPMSWMENWSQADPPEGRYKNRT